MPQWDHRSPQRRSCWAMREFRPFLAGATHCKVVLKHTSFLPRIISTHLTFSRASPEQTTALDSSRRREGGGSFTLQWRSFTNFIFHEGPFPQASVSLFFSIFIFFMQILSPSDSQSSLLFLFLTVETPPMLTGRRCCPLGP